MQRSLYVHAARAVIAVLAAWIVAGCSSGNGGGSAQIRLVNVSSAYDSLDLYAARDDESDSLKFQGIGYETASGHAALDSGTYTLKLKRHGVSSTLLTLANQQLPDDSHTTYVTYGSVGRFSAISIGEDQDPADSGRAKLHVLNTAEAGSLDVYLTDDEVSLDDASPVFGNVAAGGATSTATVDSGTYRLRVTGANDSGDVRLDLPEVALESRAVVAIILTATPGGVLVNALFLPQGGELTSRRNTKARVRAANGVSSGTVLTARVAGVTLLSNATLGAIGSQYRQVEAGTVPVHIIVDGSVVPAESRALTAGTDYTLVAWNDAEGVRTTLVVDDNRLPGSSGKSKLRVINGMSAAGVPITLALNYAPVAEGIATGQASSAMEVDSGSDNQLDVNDAGTGASVLTRSSVTLQSAAVYTMFMSGDGSAAGTVGTLRKDR